MERARTNKISVLAVPLSAAQRAEGRARAHFTPEAARRLGPGYSRFVGMMKVLLPIGAAILVALVIAWPYLQTTDGRFRIGFSTLVATQAERPNIVNPRLVGTDEKDQPFSITADLAKDFYLRQDFWGNESTPVELEMPKADIMLKDGSWLVLTANAGLLTPKTKMLELSGAVNLFHDSGYELRTTHAMIDLEKGAAVSDKPVDGQGPFGNIVAEGLRLTDKGKDIVFTGKAKLVLYPDAGKAVE
jgi:lipopolysaccharide export system protein LptC